MTLQLFCCFGNMQARLAFPGVERALSCAETLAENFKDRKLIYCQGNCVIRPAGEISRATECDISRAT